MKKVARLLCAPLMTWKRTLTGAPTGTDSKKHSTLCASTGRMMESAGPEALEEEERCEEDHRDDDGRAVYLQR